MHVYFSGIGGAAIGPLALIAHKAGYKVSGSDKQVSPYITYLKKRGITNIHIGQDYHEIEKVHKEHPIDWFVYTSALPIEQPHAPELRFCKDHTITATKRDEFLNHLLLEKDMKLIAIAGTHGKTTTTAMFIWLLKQLSVPISYSVGAKLGFGDMGEFDAKSEYFVYEADEFDRNFLAFRPYVSLITGVDWDHPDIYPTRESYNEAFVEFLDQSEWALLWTNDADRLDIKQDENVWIMDEKNPRIHDELRLAGKVNRLDAWQVIHAVHCLTDKPHEELVELMNRFPGVSRRFERLAPGIYSDYAHTAPKIRGALQIAREQAGDNVVVVYEGLHNTRQHFMKEDLKAIFKGVKKLYIVPSYLAREDQNLALLTPEDLKKLLDPKIQTVTSSAELNEKLTKSILKHTKDGDLVLCLSAGGGGSLDEWLRNTFGTEAK